MKMANVIYPMQTAPVPVFLIEDANDLSNLCELTRKAAERAGTKMVRANCPFDHMGGMFYDKPMEGLIFHTAFTLGMSNQLRVENDGIKRITNPIYLLDSAIDLYTTSIAKALIRGNRVLVNPNGGWCTEGKDVVIQGDSFDEAFDFKVSRPYLTHINRGSVLTHLILENDVELETKAQRRMKTERLDYGYIRELREYTEDQLQEMIKTFVKAGGHTLYVYTTGRDVEQARMYSRAAIKAGIKSFEFELSAEEPEGWREFILDLKKKKVKVKELK